MGFRVLQKNLFTLLLIKERRHPLCRLSVLNLVSPTDIIKNSVHCASIVGVEDHEQRRKNETTI